jgi:peptidyl-prolyl cis-trans isomerase C
MKRILFALVAVLLLAGCPSKGTNEVNEKGKKTGPVLARVGNETLTRDELLLLFRGQVPPDAPREKLQQVLESWVNGEIWYQEAERRGIGKDETTQMALRNETRNAIAAMLLARIKDTVSVSDAEVYDYFQKHKDDYTVGAKIMYVILRDPDLADKVLADLKGGADFKTTAKQVSYEDTLSRGQETPYFVRNDSSMFLLQLSPELNQAIFALQPGQLSDVITVSGAGGATYWIVKCVDRKRLKSDVKFEDVKKAIGDELLPWKQKQVVDSFAAQLEQKTKVEVMVDNFYPSAKHK